MSIASTLVPDAIRRRYALKFAIVLLILGLSVAALAVVGTGQISEQVEDRVEDDQKALAEHEARNIEQWNERNFGMASATAAGVAQTDDVDGELRTTMDEEDGLHSIHHVDLSSGVIETSTNSQLDGQPITEADETWTPVQIVVQQQGREGGEEFFWTPVPGQADDGTPVLFYGEFVGDSTDEMLIMIFDMSQYADEMISPEGSVAYTVFDPSITDEQRQLFDSDEPVMNDGPIVVMDESGQSFFEDYETADGQIDFGEIDPNAEQATFYSDVEPGPELQASAGEQYRNDRFLASTARITPGSDFFVVMHTPESEGLVFANTVREWGLLVGGAGLLLVVLIGGVLGRSTSKSINRLTEKAEQMEAGDLDVDFETSRVDSIGQLYVGFANMRDSLSNQIQTAEQAREDAEQARAETKRLNEQLEADADHFRDVLQQYAEGDLTVRMNPESDHEVMSEIATEFNQSVTQIEQTVAELARFSNEVATASEEVTASSEEVRSASQQVSDSVQQISDGAARQNQTLQTIDREMEGLSTTVEQIAASSNQVADIAARTAQTSRDGSKSAQEAMESFEQLESERQSVVEEFERLRAEVSQIDELTDTIADIAEQTNMLALNANIEASRSESGDDGGFGVVAQEVKELSTDAKEAAQEIGDRLERIQEQTERSAQEVDNTSAEFDRVSGKVREAVQALDEIADFAKETNAGVQEISAATEEQAAATEEVVAMVDEAATISEETTSEAENVAAAAEEQTTAMTEVSNSASSLSQQAAQLSEALDRFDVDIDEASGGRGVAGGLQSDMDRRLERADEQKERADEQNTQRTGDGATETDTDGESGPEAGFEADGGETEPGGSADGQETEPGGSAAGEETADGDDVVDPEDVFTFGDER